jgi:hypothetical protein
MNQATCPSCNGELKKFPARKTKCPHCGNFIYVKRAPSESEKHLVTEAQAAGIEALWDARADEQEAEEFCRLYRIDARRYEQVRNTLSKSTEPASLRWSTEYFLAREQAATETDLHVRKMLYSHLARLCEQKKLYRDRRDFTAKMHESELRGFMESMGSVIGVRVKPGKADICAACQANSGKTYTLEQALAEQPLPCAGCACGETGHEPGRCKCYYSTILRDEPLA